MSQKSQKAVKNGFFQYMLQYKRKGEAAGRTFPGGLKDVAEKVGPIWAKMSTEQREYYEKRAKGEKAGGSMQRSRNSKERYTSSGVSLSQIECEARAEKDRLERQKLFVHKIISYGVENKCLKKLPFYILSFNYFAKESNNNYFPCEMGLVKFSLEAGITKKVHTFINPGKLPLGFAYAAMNHAEQTHKLPVPPAALGSSNFTEILNEIMTCLLTEGATLPTTEDFMIFVMEEEEKMVENILGKFFEDAQMDVQMIAQYKLLPLKSFFAQLRGTVERLTGFEPQAPFTEQTADAYFDRDIFRYNRGSSCTFHEQHEVNHHCCLGRVKRWAYTILNKTCEVAEIGKQIPGFHFPADFDDAPESDYGKEPEDEKCDEVDKSFDCASTVLTSMRSMREGMKDEYSEISSVAKWDDRDDASSRASDKAHSVFSSKSCMSLIAMQDRLRKDCFDDTIFEEFSDIDSASEF